MKYILLSCILIVSHQLGAQIVWEQNYGGSSIDELVELTGGQNNELLLIGSTYPIGFLVDRDFFKSKMRGFFHAASENVLRQIFVLT